MYIAQSNELLEALAEIEHRQWMHWSKTVACEIEPTTYEKWQRNWIFYSELTEDIKEADRIWAREVFALLHARKLIP